jgi:hypothetical protein
MFLLKNRIKKKALMKLLDNSINNMVRNILLGGLLCTVIGSEFQIISIDSLDSDYDHLKNNNTVKCALWQDKNGLNFIGIDLITQGNIGENGFSSKLTGYAYLVNDTSHTEMWRIKDWAPDPLSAIHYMENSLKIEDVDNDSIAESCFMYYVSSDCCDPWKTKLMLHKNGKKYAVRGQVPVHSEWLDDYRKIFDPSYDSIGKEIKDFASLQWDKCVKLNWKQILDDSTDIERMIKSAK